ncbi:uncharacterized protein LOC134243946 [Saccostrea cucullata]|uniref:uncharacterized protein LOC134243946 n=1 Tax=Saccostrea cuccullata TaxID=36930 RepID=UPI002ED5D7C5
MQGHQIRILVVVCPHENSPTCPAFKMNSKIKFWTHLICSHDDFESVPCIENELAKTVFDCFLDLVRMKLMSGSRVTGKSEPSNDISAIAEDRVQGPVFQEYIENVLGVPLHWIDRNSQMVPDLAICLNTDNIERSVQLLQDKSAEDTILVIINHCEEGVPIKRSTIFNSRFSSVIDLRFSECFNKFYGNDTSIEELKKLLSGNKGFEIAEDTCNMVRRQKQQGQTIFSSSMDAKKESGVEEWTLVDREADHQAQ